MNKKLILIILFITIIVIGANILRTVNQLKIYQNNVNIVIANIVGEIQEKYPELSEEQIISILNMNSESLKIGYNILEKYAMSILEPSKVFR